MATSRRVAYVHSDELIAAADKLPSNAGRANLVHSLVEAFGLLESGRAGASIIDAAAATREELISYHDEGKLQFSRVPPERSLTLYDRLCGYVRLLRDCDCF